MHKSSHISNRQALFQGAAWTIAGRWAVRLLGLANTMILARLLTPADYGLVAMATLLFGVLQVVWDSGTNTYVLQKHNITEQELHAVWSVRLAWGGVAALLMAVSGPFFSWYYDHPELTHICLALAVCLVVQGLGNVGWLINQKSFSYGMEFQINVTSKVVGLAATVSLGYWLRSYWALVWGSLITYIAHTSLGYVLHAHRPRFVLAGWQPIWVFSRWAVLSSLGTYFLRRADDFLAAKFGGSTRYGPYAVGAELGALPLTELGPTMLKALLPVLARIQHSKEEMASLTLKSMRIMNAVAFPVGVGLAAVAGPATLVVLGGNWVEAVPYVAVFALISIVMIAPSPLGTLLLAAGAVKSRTWFMVAEFVGFALAAVFFYPLFGLIGLAYARLAGSLCYMLAMMALAQRICGVRWGAALGTMWRPALGAAVMYVVVQQTQGMVVGNLVQLTVGVATGGAIYTAFSLASWLACGRPEGLESTAFEAWQAFKARRVGSA